MGEMTERFRATGWGLEVSMDFNSPEKVAGEIGFGDLISGFCCRGVATVAEGVRSLVRRGDF